MLTMFKFMTIGLGLLRIPLVLGQGLPPQIPSIVSFTSSASDGAFPLSASVKIIVDSKWTDYGLPGPSLHDFANTFHDDLVQALGFVGLPSVDTASGPDSSYPTIFLTLETGLNHTLFNGQATGEGYDFAITSTAYVIAAAQPIGAWWGTRSLLQQAALIANGNAGGTISIPGGTGSDSPGWGVRGFMLDVARHFFLPSFLCEST
jgi:hexosaminidase